MLVYTDNEGRILAVGSTDDESLIEHEITDNTFDGWSDAKIMCYRVYVDSEGNVTMMTPYVPSNLIDKIAQMQTSIKALKESQVNQDELLVELLMGSMGDDDLLDIALDDDTTIEEE